MRDHNPLNAAVSPWPHRLRWLACAILATVVIVLAARRPDLAFVRDSNGWWVEPGPAEGMGVKGPFEVEFILRIHRGGIAEIAAMNEFQLLTHDGRTIASDPGHSWTNRVRVALDPGEYRLRARHPRWKPAVFVGGEVEASVMTHAAPAKPVARLSHVPPALAGSGLVIARCAPVVATIAGFLLLFWGREKTSERTPPRLTWAIVVVHAVLAGWNAYHYPIARGLDAEAHLAYARAIAEQREVPTPDAGFQTYHPPLYHALAAAGMAMTGSDRAAAWISAVSGLVMVALIAVTLRGREPIALALAAFAPVLLVSEPQVTNELVFAMLATAMLIVAAREALTLRGALALGALAGAALLTKYTGVVFAAAAVATIVDAPVPWRRRAATLAVFLVTAVAISAAPYVERWNRYGKPFIGNWDDELGQSYRQGPGLRTAAYFFRFGASLYAHPFKARSASLWDSLYLSAVGDGFGRFITSDLQHATNAALAWLALPLLVVALAGWLRCVWSPRDGHERAASYAVLFGLAAMVRFNLELPYWSTAKSVFLLGLLLPVAISFARGRSALRGRLPRVAPLLDVAAAAFVLVAFATFVFR